MIRVYRTKLVCWRVRRGFPGRRQRSFAVRRVFRRSSHKRYAFWCVEIPEDKLDELSAWINLLKRDGASGAHGEREGGLSSVLA